MARVDELNVFRNRDLSRKENVSKEIEEKVFDYKRFINEYFDPMDISEKQKEERRKLANEMFNTFLFLFSLIEVSKSYNYMNIEYFVAQFELQFAPLVMSYSRNDEYIGQYIDKVSNDVVKTTVDGLKKPEKSADREFTTSDKRAAFLSVNSSNTVENYEDIQEAIESGYRYKTWVAEVDKKTRASHLEINGTRIPIEEYFQFEDCEMFEPHDEVNGTAEQCANCRCTVHFS